MASYLLIKCRMFILSSKDWLALLFYTPPIAIFHWSIRWKWRKSIEQIREVTGNRKKEARFDVSAVNFWVNVNEHFLIQRVFDLSAHRYRNRELTKCYEVNEKEKKKNSTMNVYFTSHFFKWRYGTRVLNLLQETEWNVR